MKWDAKSCLCCPCTQRLLVLRPEPWHTLSVSFPNFCSDYELRCKTGSQQSKQNKPSAVFTFARTQKNSKIEKAAFLTFYRPASPQQRKATVYMGYTTETPCHTYPFIFKLNSQTEIKQEATLLVRPERASWTSGFEMERELLSVFAWRQTKICRNG